MDAYVAKVEAFAKEPVRAVGVQLMRCKWDGDSRCRWRLRPTLRPRATLQPSHPTSTCVPRRPVPTLRSQIVLVVIFALFCFFLLYAVTYTPKTAAPAAAPAAKAAPAKKAAAAKAPTPAKAPAKAATPTKASAASTDGPASGRRSARKRTGVERFEPF